MFVLAAALALALAPAADAGKRARKQGTVRAGHGKAPKHWRYVTDWAALTAGPAAPAPGATPTPTPTPGSALPGANPHSVSVNSTEFALTLSQTSVSAGTVRVQFDNSRAEDPHQLTIDGPDPDYWSFPQVPAGTVTQHALVMRPGRHILFCPLPEHEPRGMRAVLTVR